MNRTLTLAAAVLLAACGSDATGPAERTSLSIAGSYTLDGGVGKGGHFTPPPVLTTAFGTFHSSTLALRTDGTMTIALDHEVQGVRRTQTSEGTYQVRADSTLSVRFNQSGAVKQGRLQDDGRVMLDWEYYRLYYRRQ